MELNNLKIGEYDIQCLSKLNTDSSTVSIIRIFELNGINYISFVDDSDNLLKTLSEDKFDETFKSFLGSLFLQEKTTIENITNCDCETCKL